MPLTRRVLLVSPNSELREQLARWLKKAGLRTLCSVTVGGALQKLARAPVGLLLCEAELPDGNFRDLLRHVNRSGAAVPVVVLSPSDDCEPYLSAMRDGAFDYLAYPSPHNEMERVVHNALTEASRRHTLALADADSGAAISG